MHSLDRQNVNGYFSFKLKISLFFWKDGEDSLKKMLKCLRCEEQTQNCHCFSNNTEDKDPLMEITQTESGLQQETFSPLNTKQQSPNHRNQESVNNNPSSPDGDINWKVSQCPPVPNGQKSETLCLNLPLLKPQMKPLKPVVVASEPSEYYIVVGDVSEGITKVTLLSPH